MIKSTLNFIVSTFLLLNLLTYSVNASSDWSYNDQAAWPNEQNECSGTNQSPIDIQTNDVYLNDSLAIVCHNYDLPSLSYKATNNGHSIQFDYTGDMVSAPTLTGTALNNQEFRLAQFHFHWGSAKHIGSEHKINGRAFPIEMHLVHYSTKYNSLSQALEARDGSVAVLGVFFEIKKYNPGFEIVANMVAELQEVTSSSQSAPLRDPIALRHLLPENTEKFFRYHGSLTTPPCTEGLIWLVMNQPNEIGRGQFEKFLGVINPHSGEKMANNFRRLQYINGRKVESSFHAENYNNKAGLTGSSFVPY